MSNTSAVPGPLPDGRIHTMNRRGFTTNSPDPLSWRFIHLAAVCGAEVLDFGCAYGVATIPALKEGARVCACDMDPQHFDDSSKPGGCGALGYAARPPRSISKSSASPRF